jgi:hypothetical protein
MGLALTGHDDQSLRFCRFPLHFRLFNIGAKFLVPSGWIFNCCGKALQTGLATAHATHYNKHLLVPYPVSSQSKCTMLLGTSSRQWDVDIRVPQHGHLSFLLLLAFALLCVTTAPSDLQEYSYDTMHNILIYYSE